MAGHLVIRSFKMFRGIVFLVFLVTVQAKLASIDWRNLGAVTSVKDVNSGNCSGGTWAFATAGAVEGINQIATGELVDLSAQQLLDCETSYGNKGCRSGFPQNGFMYLGDEAAGLMADAQYPFTGTEQACKKQNGYIVSVDGYDNIYPSSDDNDIQEMVSKQPVTALVDATNPAFQNYKGGIFKGPCSNETVSISVLIVGYGTENGESYWILKNSWGTSWGEKGYMRLQRGNHGLPNGRCAINAFVWYPTKATLPLSSLLQRDLVANWKLDDKAGQVAADSSPSSASCNILTGATWESPAGLVFRGSGKVFCGTKVSMCGKTSFSLSAWVKVPQGVSSKGVIMQQRGPSNFTGVWTTDGYNGEYQFYVEGGKPTLWVFGDGNDQFRFSSNSKINDNKWHHLVAVRDGNKGYIYVDGTMVASAEGDVKNLVSNFPVYIGCDCRDSVDFFTGSLRGISIYKRALSVLEIKQISASVPTVSVAVE